MNRNINRSCPGGSESNRMEREPSEESHQNPHFLSHGGKIIYFSCKLDSTTSVNKTSELTFCTFLFEPEGNRFLKADEGAAVISRKVTAPVYIVKCKCAIDVQKRVKIPCILVTKKSVKGEKFHYCLFTLSSSNRLEPCFEFTLPYQIEDSVDILRGPTVFWSQENTAFYTSFQAEGVRKIPTEISHSVFGELPTYKGRVFVLGVQNSSEHLLKDQSTRQTFGYFPGDGQAFDGTAILPHPYISIARCMLVLSAQREDDVLECAVIAATSSQQLVWFENGTVKDVCQLPFEEPEHVQVVNTGRNGSLIVVLFKQGNVCAVWKELFQIASTWSGVSSICVDDLLGCGTEQMLLLFKDQGPAGKLLETFLITDLCGFSFSCGRDSEATSSTPPLQENYLHTVQALESRLQSGLIVLQELQREVRVKDRVLQQSVQVLTDVLSDRETVLTQHEQEGLVALWDGDDEPEDETRDDEMEETPALPSNPQLDRLWHCITGDRMVVGVILTTESAVPATTVSLSLLTETDQSSAPVVIQTQSQAFWLPARRPSTPPPSSSSSTSAFAFSEPAAKRSKQHVAGDDLHTCRLAVTAKTELAPLLTSGCVRCRVVLHYVQKADAFPPVSKAAPVALQCGQISLDIHNVCQKPLLKHVQVKTDEAREDLLSLLTVLDHWVLHIDSPDYSLGDIDGWIQKREGCKKIEVSPQYLLLDSPEPTSMILLHWDQMTPFQGELSIHSSQLQMLRFLDSLLAFLPASCFVRPVKCARSRATAQTFALALEDEVLSLRERVSLLLGEEEEGTKGRAGHEETPDPGTEEGLQRCREVWQRDVERSRTRLSPLVDVGKYRETIRSMSEVQMDGDLAALRYAQRTLLC